MTRKVGIVGARGIGERHARAYKQDPLAELVAVCDLIKERADEAAQMYGARAYTSLAEMLRHEDLDIVDVSTGGAENGSSAFRADYGGAGSWQARARGKADLQSDRRGPPDGGQGRRKGPLPGLQPQPLLYAPGR